MTTAHIAHRLVRKNINPSRRYPRAPVEHGAGEPWRPVMTEQERREHEQYVKEHKLPF